MSYKTRLRKKNVKQLAKHYKLMKIKAIVIGLAIICLAAIITLIITMVGVNKNTIYVRYDTLSSKPDNSRHQFNSKFVTISRNLDGTYTIDFISAQNIHGRDINDLTDELSNTPDVDKEYEMDITQSDTSTTTDSGSTKTTTTTTTGPGPDDANLKDVLAKLSGESGTEIGYLGVLTCVALRLNGGDEYDAAAILRVMTASGQFSGYKSSSTYASVSSAQQAAIDRYINGERAPFYGEGFTQFRGSSGNAAYGKPGTLFWIGGTGCNYHFKNYGDMGTSSTTRGRVKVIESGSYTPISGTCEDLGNGFYRVK